MNHNMQFEIKEIAKIINAKIVGDETIIVNKVSSFEDGRALLLCESAPTDVVLIFVLET